MQDLEFTIERGKLYMLQTRTGKRTGAAAVSIAVEMVDEGLIDEPTAVQRVEPAAARPAAAPDDRPRGQGQGAARWRRACRPRPARPAARSSSTPTRPRSWPRPARRSSSCASRPRRRTSTAWSPPQAILTARGGMTSHAAVVARGMGKPCVAGAGELRIDYGAGPVHGRRHARSSKGDWITLDGATGEVFAGQLDDAGPRAGRAISRR